MSLRCLHRHMLIPILAAGSFASGLNITIISPLVKPIGHDLGVTDGIVGQLVAMHAVVAGMVALVVVPVIDRYPRRRVLQLEAVLLVLATVISALAPTYAWLALGRVVAGLGGAIVFAICLALAADVFTAARERNWIIALITATFSLATIIGLPIVTLLTDSVGWRWAMSTVLLPAIILLVGTWWLPVSSPPGSIDTSHSREGYRQALANASVNWLLGAMAVGYAALAGSLVYFGAFAETVYRVQAGQLSLLFLVIGLADLLGCAALPLLLRLGSARAVYTSATLIMATSLVMLGVVDGSWLLLAPFALSIGIANAVLYLSATTLLLDQEPSARGAVMTLQTATYELGWAAGAAVTGGGLAMLGGYVEVYRILALAALGSLIFLALSVRYARSQQSTMLDLPPLVEPVTSR